MLAGGIMFLWEIIVKRHLHVCLREVITMVQDRERARATATEFP